MTKVTHYTISEWKNKTFRISGKDCLMELEENDRFGEYIRQTNLAPNLFRSFEKMLAEKEKTDIEREENVLNELELEDSGICTCDTWENVHICPLDLEGLKKCSCCPSCTFSCFLSS